MENSTTGQSNCEKWFKERSSRLTASVFGKVLKRKQSPSISFFNTLFQQKPFKAASNTWGINNEENARSKYMSLNGNIHVHGCGLIVHPTMSFLGASPDGKVCENGDTGIIEIKCPYSARNLTINEAVVNIPKFCLLKVGEIFELDRTHDFFYQVQGQLMISGGPFCDFIVYTKKDFSVQRIYPEKEFMLQMLLKLSLFYRFKAVPYLRANGKLN